jgi:hypothetical protein
MIRAALAGIAVGLLLAGPALAQAPPQPPPPPSSPEPAKPAAATEPDNLEPISSVDLTGILGKKVQGPEGEDLGLIVDVIVDANGAPRAAVIDFGGFLGVGSRKIAIDWRLLRFYPADPKRQILLSLGRAEIKGAPEYKPDAAAEMVGPKPTNGPVPAGAK